MKKCIGKLKIFYKQFLKKVEDMESVLFRKVTDIPIFLGTRQNNHTKCKIIRQTVKKASLSRFASSRNTNVSPSCGSVPHKMSDVRICLVTDTLCDANGVSRFIQDIAHCAIETKHTFLALCATKKGYCHILPNMQIFNPSIAIRMPFYHELDLVLPPFLKLYRAIKTFSPDIIHIATPGITGWMALWIAKRLNLPVTGTYHTDFPAYLHSNTGRQWIYHLSTYCLKRFYNPFSSIFIRSEVYRQKLREELGFSSENILTIPPGIDTKKFDPKFCNRSYWHQYRIPSNAKILLYIGRISVEKNIHFLTELFSRLQKDPSLDTKNVHLVLVGSGAFVEKIAKLHIPNLHLLGHKGGLELSTIYASSDLFLFPSTTDTLGQVVIEAMASGLPVIASDQGGPKTIIGTDAKVGYTLDIHQPNLWKTKLYELVTNDTLRIQLAQNAHQKASLMQIEKSFHFWWEQSAKMVYADTH